MRAKAHANTLEEIDYFLFGEIGRAIKCHVFGKVRQSLLVFVFQNRSRIDYEAQFGAVFRSFVFPDYVAKPICQFARSHSRIDGQGR